MKSDSNLVEKPWGSYTDYHRGEAVVFKSLEIKPGHCISYQKHEHRGEFWFVFQGNPVLKISTMPDPLLNFAQSVLEEGQTVEIPAGMWHQISVPEDGETAIIWEMQYGTCSEDDIERIDDPYNRN